MTYVSSHVRVRAALGLLLAIISTLVIQFSYVHAASAYTSGYYTSGDTAVGLDAYYGFDHGLLEVTVCNNGATDIKQVDLNPTIVGYEIEEIYITDGSFGDVVPEDTGSIDPVTFVWTGMLRSDDDFEDDTYPPCLRIAFAGHPAVEIGETFSASFDVTSVVLDDDTVVDDLDGNGVILDDVTRALSPDLAVETRLVTTGEVLPNSHVFYEISVKNVGLGNLVDTNGFFMLAFIIPEGSTFVAATDGDADDKLDTQACSSPGTVEDIGMTGLAQYSGSIIVCNLQITGNEMLEPGFSGPVKIEIIAGEDFAAGTAEVVGFIQANEGDTMILQRSLVEGGNPLDLGLNNAIYLSYDPDDLRVTINPCAGQGATVSDGNACFTVSFSKLIYAPSFTVDDLDLGGVGTISGFTQLDDYTWRVNISGIAPGQTLTLSLKQDSVQDYSAVLNNVNVLGVNTVRYEVAGSASSNGTGTLANGTLPSTGNQSTSAGIAAVLLMALGGILLVGSARKINS